MSLENIIPGNSSGVGSHPKVLVTGATGFLGRRLVEILLDRGYQIRALARKLSNIERLRMLDVEIFYGDVGNRKSIEPAFEGIDVVVHAAADTSGKKEAGYISTIVGTRNVSDLCREYNIKKLIYISSCSVYGVAGYKTNYIVTEEDSLEMFPEKRGYYSASKQIAEGLVIEAIKKENLQAVILRPGTIYGPGGALFTPMIGFSAMNKIFAVIGNGSFEIPFVYIDNFVDAIILSIQKKEANQQIFNVVDSEIINKKTYMSKLIKAVYPRSFVIYFPYSLMYLMVWVQEILCRLLRRPPFLTRYRLASSQKYIRYDSSKIIKELKWHSNVSIDEAVSAIMRYENNVRQV